MKINATWKDVIYIGTIVVAIALHFISEGKEKAALQTIVEGHTSELKEINAKLDKYEGYWMEQKEINGSVITALGIDVE